MSLAFAIRKEIAWNEAFAYVPAQIGGGVLGAMLANLMFDLPVVELSTHARHGLGQWVSEGVATFSLIVAIVGALRSNPRAVPLVVASVIAAAYWFTASTSFANPAVTVARMFSNTFAGIAPADVPAFVAAQLIGAGVAVLTARALGWK